MDGMKPEQTEAPPSELELMAIAANESSYALYITDRHANLIYVNRKFTAMFGYEAAEVLGRPGRDVLGTPHFKEADYQRMWTELMAGRELREEVRTLDKAGEDVWVTLTLRPLFDAAGDFQHLVGIMEDTTESRQIQALQRDVLEAVAEDRPLAEVMELICQQVEVTFPEVVSSVVAVNREGLLKPLAGPSLPAAFGALVDGAPIGPMAGSCGTAAYFGRPVTVEDIETDPRWLPFNAMPLAAGLKACWSSPIKLRDGRVAGTFAFYFREKRGPSASHERIVAACLQLCVLAFDRHEAQLDIAKLAYYDTLTGLPNRSMLRRELDAALASNPDMARAFLFLDLDRFKDVNDTLGHSVGDELLVEVAARIRREVRPTDLVCRLGGDEFVIVLEGGDPGLAADVALRISRSISAASQIVNYGLPTTTSIGISLYPRDGRDIDTLLKHADTAMYQAKAEGKARHRFFSDEMNRLAQDRVLLGVALRDVVTRRGLQLFYQPQIAADGSERLVGVEALARWQHPSLGEISPDRFIRLAEENGLIEQIGDWAIDQACRQLASWDRCGSDVPAVSVNISVLQFRSAGLPATVLAALGDHGIAPSRLTLEITESVAMDDCPTVTDNLQRLSAMGVRISMDDFGTGYSSLSHLARLTVDELKIDRSFMRELEASDARRTLVTAVIRIGQSLGMSVVAEGVETEAQRRFLQALDCDVLQGFLYSKALPAEEFSAWLATRERGTLPEQRGVA
jgi:diguanylate cyclase (GGDEF)-like protein/PAS domain S-box-containing protein